MDSEDELDRDVERLGQAQAAQVPHFPQVPLGAQVPCLASPLPGAGHQRQITVAEPEPQPANMPTPRAPQPAPGTPLQTAMQQPDRLGPYVADDAPWNDYCPGL